MIDASGEADFWRLEGIVRGEVYVEEEDTSAVWAVVGTHYRGLPVEEVILLRARAAVGGRVPSQLL